MLGSGLIFICLKMFVRIFIYLHITLPTKIVLWFISLPRKQFTKESVSNEFYLRGSKTYSVSNLNRGIIAIGGAGSGKTYSLIKPLINYCIDKKGCITFDPKGELSPLINAAAEAANKPILNFSLDENLDCINPLLLCDDQADVIEFSNYFLSSVIGIPKNDTAKYFFNAAKGVLSGVILFLKNLHPKCATIPHFVAIFLTANPEQVGNLLARDPQAKRASMVLSSVKADPKLLGSIISTLTAFFSGLDSPKIFRNLITDVAIPIPNNPENPSVVNLIFNLQKRDLYSPIYSSIIGLLLKKMNTPGQFESAVIIDEFTVLSIPNFVNIPETARSNKIATCLAIQDVSQLVARYGREDSSSIIANMGSQFLFRTTNPETLNHFQSMLGVRDEIHKSQNRSKDLSFSRSENTSTKEKKILRKEEVISYSPGQVTAIIAEGSHKLIEGDRINGNHYRTEDLKTKPLNNVKANEESIYNQVYEDVEKILNDTAEIKINGFDF